MFIFGVQVHRQNLQVMFGYWGHRVKVKVTTARKHVCVSTSWVVCLWLKGNLVLISFESTIPEYPPGVCRYSTWVSARCMQVRIGIGVMKCRPVMLIGTVCVPRPLKEVLCSLVVENKFHKFATKDAVRTATDDVDVVRRRCMRSVHVDNFS